jgi:hypothetical protein
MSTVNNVLTFARAQCQTDPVGLTDTNGIVFANEALLDFRRRLQSASVDAAQLQEAYANMTANTGTYLYPADMAWLKAIELNYANQTPESYLNATQVDVANLPDNKSFGWLRKNASTANPFWNDMGDWFEVFPTPVVANAQGIRIFYYLEPTEFTATSDTISYPESLDYRILGWRIAGSYLKSLMKIDEGSAFLIEYENRVKQLIATLSRGSQQPIQATPIQDSGWNF